MTDGKGGVSENGPESEVEAEIMDTVTLTARGVSGGKAKVTVSYTGGDTPEILYSDKLTKDFVEQRTPRGQIKNKVKAALEGYEVDPDAWVEAYTEWTNNILANSEEAAVSVVNEAVKGLAEGTKAVHMGKAGDDRKWDVKLTWNGKEGTLRFDAGDMATGGTGTLKTQMFAEFGNCPPGIETEEWESLKAYWLDIQQETFEANITERDRAKEMFLDKLRDRVTAYDDAEALGRDKTNAWVDDGNEYGLELNGLAGDVDGVAWVRNDFVNAVVDEMDNAPAIGKLASELQQSNDVIRPSTNRTPHEELKQRRYWFFDADSLNVQVAHEWDQTESDDPATGEVDA